MGSYIFQINSKDGWRRMANDLFEQIRHECRNGVVSIQHNVKRIAVALSAIEEAEMEIRKALVVIADQESRMENAINFLDQLEKDELTTSKDVVHE